MLFPKISYAFLAGLLFCGFSAFSQTEDALLQATPTYVSKAMYLAEPVSKTLGPTKNYSQMPSAGMFELTFASGYSEQAQEAVMFAAGILNEMIILTDTVEIMCNWNVASSSNNLGSCGPDNWYSLDGAIVPQSLAKQLTDESNLNDMSEFDLTLNLNAGRTDWYFGTDAACPPGEFDLVTVAMHEILHGMGWLGLFSYDFDAAGVFVTNWNFPSTYDNLVTDGSGTLITSLTQTEAANAMVNQLQFSGATSVNLNGGVRPELYAPTTWDGGSSYGHFDESTFAPGTVNALMTPFTGNGEVHHTPGPVGLAVLGDQGYNVNIVFGCTDPEGCNYDPDATFDDGSCITTGKTCMDPLACNYDPTGTCNDDDLCEYIDNVFIPTEVGDGPAYYDCTLTPATGYEWVEGSDESYCVSAAIWFQPECMTTNWDENCVNAYNACFYGPVDGCTDSFACNYDPNANTEDGSCEYGDWIIPGPLDGEDLPPFGLDCDVDGDDFLSDCLLCLPGMVSTQNEDQTQCVLEVLQADNYCLVTDWDNICQDAYEACLPTPPLQGCMNPLACNFNPDANIEGLCLYASTYYLPIDLSAGLPIEAVCFPFDLPGSNYAQAESDECVQWIVTETPSCGTNWDLSCQSAYETCMLSDVFGCTDPLACNYVPSATADDWSCIEADYLLIPTPENVGNNMPMLPFCGSLEDIPTGYMTGDENCIAEIVTNDSYCVNVQWDNVCQTAYDNCIVPGCTNSFACNYDPAASVNDGSCLFIGSPCDDGDACTFFSTINSNCNCVGFITDTDGDGVCNVEDCDPDNPFLPDMYGSCETGTATCHDHSAFNYDPSGDLDGLCIYRPESCNFEHMIEPGVHIGAIGGALGFNSSLDASEVSYPFRHVLLGASEGTIDSPLGTFYAWEAEKPIVVQFSYALEAGGEPIEPFYFVNLNSPEIPLPTDQPFDLAFDFFPNVEILPAGQITPGDLYTFPPYDLVGLTDSSTQMPDVHYQAVVTVELEIGDRLYVGYHTQNPEAKMLINCILHNFTCSGTLAGCTYPAACNYLGIYPEEDGSCIFPTPGFTCDGDIIEIGIPGCTYSEACNYNDEAEFDDGTCAFPEEGFNCFGEAVGGVSTNTCPSDIDADGVIAVNDLLLLLGDFGDPCPE
jgi:hypothetical protein